MKGYVEDYGWEGLWFESSEPSFDNKDFGKRVLMALGSCLMINYSMELTKHFIWILISWEER